MFAEAKTEAWSGRFAAPMDELLTDYQQCLDIDIRLAGVDIAGNTRCGDLQLRSTIGRPNPEHASNFLD